MKIIKKYDAIRIPGCGQFQEKKYPFYFILFTLLLFGLWSCSDFVEVDSPNNLLISETVFNDPATVESALANLYFKIREQGMLSGNLGLTTGLGIYSDELDYYGFSPDDLQLYNHNVLAGNNKVLNWWTQAYSIIYSANDIIKGVPGSDALTADEKSRFEGQALFIRAYLHSLLVMLFGDVPYVTTTDYFQNNTISRSPVSTVYENIIKDLTNAVALLEGLESISNERVVPDEWAAKALLARIYLYTENWELAASMATEPIDRFGLESNLTDVFLKESLETIWQLKPGEFPRNTREATQLIIQVVPGQTYALTDELIGAFEDGDLRRNVWTDSISDMDGTVTLSYAHKYKANLNETQSLEYSILLRSAELYLIRAEARAYLGNISGAQEDLNAIRNRAGLSNIATNNFDDLLEAILRERRVELFTEQGHRWFDIKRTNTANQVLGDVKQNWQPTDVLLPIPEAEIELNPNLLPQNDGY